MSTVDESKTLGRARLTFANEAEIDEFVTMVGKYERGEITPDQWRAYRLVRGTYGQRQLEDAQMLRVKIPQGVLTANQLEALADVGEQYSRGFGHITTRQNMQFHFVKLHDVEPAMRRLAEDGLTTREACGNSVRNITACPFAGVASDEIFDVSQYADAMTRFLLRHRLTSTLPRKFKIAFEGCPVDHIATPINDLGFRAVLAPGGGRGFRVTVGGGTAILVKNGTVLHDFIPASEIFRVAEAVLHVFHEFGDYKHKQRNRTKFMIRELGWTRFRQEYDLQLSRNRLGGVPTLEIDPPQAEDRPDWPLEQAPELGVIAGRVGSQVVKGPGLVPVVTPLLQIAGDAYAKWRESNVRPQKQFGFTMAIASVPLGDLTSSQMRVMAELTRAYSDGTVRITMDQNLVFRWVTPANLRPLYRRLAAAGLSLAGAETIADVISCPGAESCRLAVTQSRGLGRLLEDQLRARPDLIAAAADARIKISGCPNGCGQHHIATIGFQGSVRRIGSRPVPQYFVMIGGGASGEEATFARLAAKVPARRIPEVVERLLGLYARERQAGESATEFFARLETARVKDVLQDLEQLTAEDAVSADFIDLGEVSEFNPLVMEGECSA
jgi:sulfite reductase beta subunit-like hemoprotein